MFSCRGCHITCVLNCHFQALMANFKGSHAEIYLSATASGMAFVTVATWPPTLCSVLGWTNQDSRLMWRDALIIVPSPPQLNSPSCWLSITHFILLLSSAGVPAGAARLPCRKVTTRGQSNVITVGGVAEVTSLSCWASPFSFLTPAIREIKCIYIFLCEALKIV